MHNTRSESLDIARRYVDGELAAKEAENMLGLTHSLIHYRANEYRRSIGETVTEKPRNTTARAEVADADEPNRLSSLSRERMIDEVIRAKGKGNRGNRRIHTVLQRKASCIFLEIHDPKAIQGCLLQETRV